MLDVGQKKRSLSLPPQVDGLVGGSDAVLIEVKVKKSHAEICSVCRVYARPYYLVTSERRSLVKQTSTFVRRDRIKSDFGLEIMSVA
jgi:hypothetical protein